MATIFSSGIDVGVKKIVHRQDITSTYLLMADGTVRHIGAAYNVNSETPFAPPLPPGVHYVDIEADEWTQGQHGVTRALLSDGNAVHWRVVRNFSSVTGGLLSSFSIGGKNTIDIDEYLRARQIPHDCQLRRVGANNGCWCRFDGQMDYVWMESHSPVKKILLSGAKQSVVLLEDGSIMRQGVSIINKFIDPDWKFVDIQRVGGGDVAESEPIIGITEDRMAVQLTMEIANLKGSDAKRYGIILPVPGAVTEKVETFVDSVDGEDGVDRRPRRRGLHGASRRSYRSQVRWPDGKKQLIYHISPNSLRAATRVPRGAHLDIPSANYDQIVSKHINQRWMSMIQDAVANDRELTEWLPASIRKNAEMRGMLSLMKL